MKFQCCRHALLMLIVSGLCIGCLVSQHHAGGTAQAAGRIETGYPVHWYERNVKQQAWISPTELAVFPEKGQADLISESVFVQYLQTQVTITDRHASVIFLETGDTMSLSQIRKRTAILTGSTQFKTASPVFYSRQAKSAADRFVLTGEIVLQYPESYSRTNVEHIEKTYGLKRIRLFRFSKNSFLYRGEGALESLETANKLFESGHVVYAYPNRLGTRTKKDLK